MQDALIVLMVTPDFGGISVQIIESPAVLLWLVFDCPGRDWPTLCMSGAQVQHLYPDGQFRQLSLTKWIDEAELAPLFSVQGVWCLLQLTALQKDEPFVKDATGKVAPCWTRAGLPQLHAHTFLYTNGIHISLLHFAVAAVTNRALIGWWRVQSWDEETVGQESVWRQTFLKCAAVASPSGSLEIYLMVNTRCLFVVGESI